MEEFINIKNVCFNYSKDPENKKKSALENISLKIERGDFIAIIGKNGCGKSTFAKHINAILLPCSGSVTVDGLDSRDENNIYKIRQKIGMVLQNPDNQIVASIVEEDVAFGLENLGIERNKIRIAVDKALKAVGMYEFRKRAPYMLSGGQKQRVAIAGAVAMNPDCIVLDEPTSMLDPQGREEVLKTILTLNKENGTAIIIITHNMEEAALVKTVVVMDEGQITATGTPENILSNIPLMKLHGLSTAQTTQLLHRIKSYGYNLSLRALGEQECINQILQILKK